MAYTVYCHINRINGKRYVGITKQDPKRRWENNGKGYKNGYFKHAIDKYGWEEFTHEILFTNLTEDEAKAKEKYLIAKWDLTNPNKGYNLTLGGEGRCGAHLSDDAKLKISLANTGRTWTDEHRKLHSNLLRGKKFTSEHRKKLFEANRCNFKPVVCIETGIVYDNVSMASRETNINRGDIRRVCNGVRNIAKGLHFKWYEGCD